MAEWRFVIPCIENDMFSVLLFSAIVSQVGKNSNEGIIKRMEIPSQIVEGSWMCCGNVCGIHTLHKTMAKGLASCLASCLRSCASDPASVTGVAPSGGTRRPSIAIPSKKEKHIHSGLYIT